MEAENFSCPFTPESFNSVVPIFPTANFTCTCSHGYNGSTCEGIIMIIILYIKLLNQIDINECQTIGCYNNSTCRNTQGNFTCGSCPPGMDGDAIGPDSCFGKFFSIILYYIYLILLQI